MFEAVKRQGNPDGLLTAAVFGKPKLGRIFAGRRFDGRRRDADHLWAPCDSGPGDEDYCGQVPLNPANGYAVDDKTVMDEVLRTIREGVGTPKRRPDFTFVNLHQADSAGHAFGTGTGAYDVAIGQADDEIERLVGELRARGEWNRTALILLSDHSMDTTPTKTTLSSRLEGAGIPEDSFLIVQNGSLDMVYLANRTSPGRFELLKRMRAAALGSPGVAEAFYREANPADGGNAHSLAGARYGWRLAGPRTGDLVVSHTPGGSFSDPSSTSNPLPGNHGGAQTLDNFFAVAGGAFVRQGMPPGRAEPLFYDTLVNPLQAENVDPAPTMMGLMGLAEPRDNAGRFLGEAFDLSAVPGRGVPARRASVRVRRTSKRVPRRRVRSRSACRRYRARRVRLRVSLGPRESRYVVQVRRRGGRFRTIARNRKRSVLAYRARPSRRLRFRARLRAASGRGGPWGSSRAVRIRPRALRTALSGPARQAPRGQGLPLRPR